METHNTLPIWKNYWKILLLDREPFEKLLGKRDAVWFALKICLLVGLVAGLGKFGAIPQIRQQTGLIQWLDTLTARVETIPENLPPFLAQIAEQPVYRLLQGIAQFQATLRTFEPPLGRVASGLVRLVGSWLATPLFIMSLWLPGILFVSVCAKWMGGPASLRQCLSLGLLALAPQALTIARFLPNADTAPLATIASILNAIAIVWSLAILVLAVAVANRFSAGKAFQAVAVALIIIYVALPAAVATLLGLIGAVIWNLIF